MDVVKRDGTVVAFNKQRIFNAVKKAVVSTNSDLSDDFINELISEICIWDNMSVEDIQDQVVELLFDHNLNNLASSYQTYREDRALVRKEMSKLTSDIDKKLRAVNVENQNANVDERSFGGRLGEATRVVTKNFALNYCMSELSRENHLTNQIYIHDLDSYAVGSTNCLTVPFEKLLRDGFSTRQVDIRPAGSVDTALQLIAVIFQLQSLQQFGGVAAGSIDWDLVPYVRKSFFKHWRDITEYQTGYKVEFEKDRIINTSIEDEVYKSREDVYEYAYNQLIKEVDQGVEGLYHNLNSLQSRSGNQLPFTSLNFGTCTLPEGRIIIRALLEGAIKGVGKYHKTPIFPCNIFKIKSGVNKEVGTPNYDLKQLALKCTAKRMYPNYANVDWSVNAGYDPNDPHTQMCTMGKQCYSSCKISLTLLRGVKL